MKLSLTLAKTFVDLYIPKKQIAFFVEEQWRGKGNRIDFKVKRGLLEQNRIMLENVQNWIQNI